VPNIYLVRHAEPAALWGAHPDPGLSDLGQSQAQAAAQHLALLGARSLVTSPLTRCRETALALEATLGIQAVVNRAVAEIPVPAEVSDHRTWLMAVMNGHWSDAHVGAALVTWRQGVAAALLELAEDTIIFSHFVAINAAVSVAMGSDKVTVFKPGHASITVLEAVDGALRLVELGQESAIHLA
jgi:broad specificity phosphatase PhoE